MQAVIGKLVKGHLAQQWCLDLASIYHSDVMLCYDKKLGSLWKPCEERVSCHAGSHGEAGEGAPGAAVRPGSGQHLPLCSDALL